MTEAQGFFTLTDRSRPVLMVATGTRVCPFRAMLQALAAGGGSAQPVRLLLGVRTEIEVIYGQEFAEIVAQNPWLKFDATLSRADAAWTGRRGYAQQHVPELVASLGGDWFSSAV